MPRKTITQNLAGSGVRYLRINADQTTDELTAAQMLAALGVVTKRNATDTTRTSTTPTTDADFTVTLGAGETWRLDYELLFLEANSPAGTVAQLAIPASTTAAVGRGSQTSGSQLTELGISPMADGTTPFPLVGAGADDGFRTISFSCTITSSAGGTVALQWCASDAAGVTLVANSSVVATRLF